MEESKIKVLVAEDEQDIGRLVKFTLERNGYDVTLVTNGQEAVDWTMANSPDLILLDVNMPVMNGYDACRAIKNTDRYKEVPIVILSARAQKTEIAEGFDSGADDYICKPFTPRELADKVNSILGKEPQPSD